MTGQATNADGDTGRFKMLADWEHDDPELVPEIKQPFKRFQRLTDAALFKAKVLAVLDGEMRAHWRNASVSEAMTAAASRIEAIEP